MRKSVAEKLADLKRKRVPPQQMTIEDLLLLLVDGDRPRDKRKVNPTQRAFIYDNENFSGFMGPKGSAKTSGGCAKIWLRALLQPGTKAMVGRQDYNDLKLTTRLRMQEMLNKLPPGTLLDRSKDPPEVWTIQGVPTLDPDGGVLDDTPSQITFMGIDSVGEAGSYEFDCAFLDEASEMEERSVHAVNGLMRNIPKSWPEGDLRYSTSLAWNPTDTFHWLYRACTGRDHTGRVVGHPWIRLWRPGRRENQRNLPSDYYDRLASSMPEDMRVRLVDGDWGGVFEGAPVVRQFKYDLHVKDNLMERYDRYAPLLRFWDFGYRRPFLIWAQPDFQGRLLHLKEFMGENQEIKPFIAAARVKQKLWFPDHKEYYDYGDPAARQHKDTGSTMLELHSEGIILRWKISKDIEDGLNVVRLWMERIIDGEPALQYDREGCPILIQAWRGGYHMDERYGQKPIKDGYYDHPADANRYGIFNLFGIDGPASDLSTMPQTLEYQVDLDPQLVANLPDDLSYKGEDIKP